jgi:hypothetical protein
MPIHLDLLGKLPKEQIEKVFHQKYCDIDPEFLGFLHIYKALSEIIPRHWTVVDLGCAYNPQCFYFLNHKSYLAVDIDKIEKFQSPNCILYNKSIQEFIREDTPSLNLSETFAILNYVPLSNTKSVRETFNNLYIYYPSGGNKRKN